MGSGELLDRPHRAPDGHPAQAGAIRDSLPQEPLSAAAAADRIARALGTPNVPDEPPVVSAFAVRWLIACGL
ncbi:hypothetical protein [Streptomyces sp. NPDC093568]|uniref:hypothetical protein n=1 Tax=Streptomyces sp. NPDC093568 TaxID=3366041 RepID=UPI0037F52E8F